MFSRNGTSMELYFTIFTEVLIDYLSINKKNMAQLHYVIYVMYTCLF